MPHWMEVVLFNAMSASLLALLVAVVAPRIPRPGIVHALWLCVLLKLIAPPILEVGMVPRWDPSPPQHSSTEVAAPQSGDPQVSPVDDNAFSSNEAVTAATTIAASVATKDATWPQRAARFVLFGSCTVTALLLSSWMWLLIRFRRRLHDQADVPVDLQSRANQLARRFGMQQQPRLRIVSGQIPPSLWPGLGGCEILLPAGLLDRLSREECDALLSHELAHLKRRDHWLRPLELVIVALYWWHPVAWWARLNLRHAEEQACDALVLQTLANGPRVYAESLLKTVEFLAYPNQPVPLLATGATGTSRLKERITMIMRKKTPAPSARGLRPILLAALMLVLMVSPAWVQKASSTDKPFKDDNPEHQHQAALLQIQEREIQLQREIQRLEQERQNVRMQIDEKLMQQQLEDIRQDIAMLEKDGRNAEAKAQRERMVLLQREAATRRQQVEAERAQAIQRMQIEHQLQDLMLQMQKAEMAGELQRVRDLQEDMFALERKLRTVELENMQAEIQRQQQHYEQEKKELEGLKP